LGFILKKSQKNTQQVQFGIYLEKKSQKHTTGKIWDLSFKNVQKTYNRQKMMK
jgi:hypothetical protein